MIIYHVRPMDLHVPGEHCNTYDCTGVVMKHDYDSLAARLAEAERLLGLALIARDNVEVAAVQIREFLNGASDNGAAYRAGDRALARRAAGIDLASDDEIIEKRTADNGSETP